jgi:hypothetical protein
VTLTLSAPTKRKTAFEYENIIPSKKIKFLNGSSIDTLEKTTNVCPTKAHPFNGFSAVIKPTLTSPRRQILPACSLASRLNTNTPTSKLNPLTAPAGRSPTQKRSGILNRKTASPLTKVDRFKLGTASAGLGFSIDAALSGTIPSYGERHAISPALPVTLNKPETKGSLSFNIHEDTPEEWATNMMEHSACTLDISSDEESTAKMKDKMGKENIPPLDDISQSSTAFSGEITAAGASIASASLRRYRVEGGACDVNRAPLGEMAAEDFYGEGCNGSSVFIVPAESDLPEEGQPVSMTFDFIA